MKRLSFCLAILLILSFGLAYAQPPGNTFVRLGNVTPTTGAGKIGAGVVVSFPIIIGNRDTNSYNASMGWIIFSDADGTAPTGVGPVRGDGTATWAHATTNGGNYKFAPATAGLWLDTTGVYPKSEFGGLFKFNCFGCDGAGADTVGFGGAANDAAQVAIRPKDSGIFCVIKVLTKLSDTGKYICIDSTTNYPPSNTWKWPSFNFTGAYSAFPTWSGAQCFQIFKPANQSPNLNCDITNLTGSHCGAFAHTFTATDPEGDSPLVWSLGAGSIGSINPATGQYTANGVATGTHTVVVIVTDPTGSNTSDSCQFDVVATNVGPSIVCPNPNCVTISVGDTKQQDVNASDDCDPLTFFIANNGGAVGATTIDPSTGVVSYTANAADVPSKTMSIGVTDGIDTSYCNICWNILVGCAYRLTIEKKHNVLQGMFSNVDITLGSIDNNEGLGGFDLLIAYDNSALSFQTAVAGAIYAQCGWEYFTYRFGANGNCSGGCPSGLIRLVGIAETNNGANHPTCTSPKYVGALPTTLASLQFLVSNNRTFECQFVPIRFFWVDCGDNTLSNASGNKLFIDCQVFDYDNANPIQDNLGSFPTYLGAPDGCKTTAKDTVLRNIDFYNGGIDIVCADSIDARGDINLNGLSYEIADAVMLTNYFIGGLGAFGTHVQGSIAASDVNADGIPLSVADLVYLIRVIVGDAAAYPKASATAVSVSTDKGMISIDGAELGAVFMVLKGNVNPILVAEKDNATMKNARMEFAFDGANTRVLVHIPYDLSAFSMAAAGFSGNILNVEAEIVSIEMADINSSKLEVALPKNYSLLQNYPNPFNPTTTISFDMPKAGAYTVTIYNVTGQKVTEFAGDAAAGTKKIEWNASNNASGVYFYKLETAGFTATKKAVLLK